MENFVVSARKYRPSTFDTVVGQQSITNTLKNAIKNNHLAQAFLFCGPRGVGKTSCARILAKTINCMNLTENIEACDNCDSCNGFNDSHSFNIHELDAASNNGVDKIRELVDQVRFAPQVGKYNIYIIDEVHMLSQAAFNAFLKTLEEPPAHALFILATTEKHKIIPTILSRCQIFDFKRIQIEDIANHLAYVAKSEGITAEEEALHTIAQKADGALRDALSIFDQIISFCGNNLTYKDVIANLNILDYDYYFKATDALANNDIPSSLNLFNDILNSGFDGHHFINGLGMHFRNLLVAKDPSTLSLLEEGENVKKRYLEQSQNWKQEYLLKGLELCNKVDLSYKLSKNQRLLIEITLMQLCSIDSLSSSTEKKTFVVKKQTEKQPKSEEKKAKEQGEKTAEAVSKPIAKEEIVIEKDDKKSIKIVNFKDTIEKKTISIKINKNESEEKENVEEQKVLNQRETPFTLSDLETVWTEYSTLKQKEGKHNLFSILNEKKFKVEENYNITLTVDNKVQEEVLIEEKTNLVYFLKNKLKNDILSLKIDVKQLEQKELTAYTDEDKFKKMAEKKPILLELKNQFNLELDY
ncbi:MAG: DNA polymerase III subunit gamma/tau [Flavobacteriales bacterium]|nr:DNA polymerase III subunit gamma/tau [Flavobacteriales bacterium]MBL6872986.1 DNA polymerase III subunit gamma/tau [Flavobacteriales bacterium]